MYYKILIIIDKLDISTILFLCYTWYHIKKKEDNNRANNTSNQNINNRQNTNNRQNQNTNYGNPFGINPNQLLSMFGNIDMNQINNMLQSMGSDNIDFNNLNLGSIQNLMNGFNGGMPGGNSTNQNKSNNSKQNNKKHTEEDIDLNLDDLNLDDLNLDDLNLDDLNLNSNNNINDENIQMLISLRSFVDEERKIFIDRIIKVYNEGGL